MVPVERQAKLLERPACLLACMHPWIAADPPALPPTIVLQVGGLDGLRLPGICSGACGIRPPHACCLATPQGEAVRHLAPLWAGRLAGATALVAAV